MSPRDPLRTPLKHAKGLGSAKSGTGHFITQRVTAIALIPLSLYVMWLVLSLADASFGEVRSTVAHPVHATLLIAFLLSTFWHAQLGMQVIVEDYVHRPALAITAQLAIIFACALAGLASVIAVLRITFAGA